MPADIPPGVLEGGQPRLLIEKNVSEISKPSLLSTGEVAEYEKRTGKKMSQEERDFLEKLKAATVVGGRLLHPKLGCNCIYFDWGPLSKEEAIARVKKLRAAGIEATASPYAVIPTYGRDVDLFGNRMIIFWASVHEGSYWSVWFNAQPAR